MPINRTVISNAVRDLKINLEILRFRQNDRSGFTLIELLVAISIIAVLATVGLIVFETTQSTGRDGKRIADIGQITNALETYYANNNGFPSPLSSVCTNSTTSCDFSSDNFSAMSGYFTGGKIPQDPSSTTAGPVYYKYYSCPGTNLPKAYVICATLENSGNVNQKASIDACNFTFSTAGSNNYFCKPNKLQGT